MYAQSLGYPDSVVEFKVEHEGICKEAKCDVQKGIDLKAFEQITNADPEGDYFCTDEQLEEFLKKLQSSPAAPVLAASSPTKGRADLVAQLFKAADRNGNGFLDCAELFPVAQLLGYPESVQAFANDFEELVTSLKADSKVGIDATMFAKEVDDPDGDFYIEDQLMEPFLKDMTAQQASKLETPSAKAVAAASAPDDNAKSKRAQLLDAVFNTLDKNKASKLKADELLRFAKHLGFPDDLDFTEEFTELCKESSSDPMVGLDRDAFNMLASTEDSDYYADDAQLSEILTKLTAEPSAAAAPEATVTGTAPAAEIEANETPRADRIGAMFEALDMNKKGRLLCAELFMYAQLKGFPGSVEDFNEEYTDICKEVTCDYQVGLDKTSFGKIIADKESDYHADDAELKDLTQKLKATQAFREEQMLMIFKAADRNKDGNLNRNEMFKVAQLMGFQDAEETFQEHWQELCRTSEVDMAKGIDAKAFAVIVNDLENDLHIETEDLAEFLQNIQK
jgi:Ca2+-binding EF-hand superfamily protein